MAQTPLSAEAKLLRLSDVEIRKIFADADRDIAAILRRLRTKQVRIGSQTRRAQLQVRRRLNKAIRDAGDFSKEGIARAVREATKSYGAADRAFFRRLGVNPEKYMQELAAAAEASITSLQSKKINNIKLPDRVYRQGLVANGKIDSIVNSAIARGASAAELAAQVHQHVNPSTPGGARYAAQRLARTEINNAFHQTAKDRYKTNPFVPWVQWNLSGSHKQPDLCNQYAEEVHDPPKGEAGWFANGKVPGRPHPNCLCYITPVAMDEKDFMEQLVAGEFDDFDVEVDNPEEAAALSKPGIGRLVVWDDAKLSRLEKVAASSDEEKDRRDRVLEATAKSNGPDAKPKVVDKLPGNNPLVYRGLPNAEYASAYKNGEYFAGTGIRGNGSYWTTNKGRAEARVDPSLRYGTGENGVLLRSEMAESAAIAKEAEIFDLIESGKLPPRIAALVGDDVGKAAAMMGYDAVQIRQILLVLNRGAQVVAK